MTVIDKWFSSPYSDEDKQRSIAGLKFLVTESSTHSAVAEQILRVSGEILLSYDADINAVSSQDIHSVLYASSALHRQDFLVLALLLCLCETQYYPQRLSLLLKYWGEHFQVMDNIPIAIKAIIDNDVELIKQPEVMGEGYQNKQSRENAIATLGVDVYNRHMDSMQKGIEDPELKMKFAFINDLPINTVGGQLREILHAANLSLPGEAFGFPEYFIWHESAHILSGNSTNYAGELGTNVFTAASSNRSRFEILIWGLLQFNLGFSLAVVATPSKDNFKKNSVVAQYCYSLLSGANTTLDILNWPIDVMIEDLKMDLTEVREKYNIIVNF